MLIYLNLVMIGPYQTLRETSNAFSAACLGSRLGIFWALLVSAKRVDQSVRSKIHYFMTGKKNRNRKEKVRSSSLRVKQHMSQLNSKSLAN
jgi:hypothetical protein